MYLPAEDLSALKTSQENFNLVLNKLYSAIKAKHPKANLTWEHYLGGFKSEGFGNVGHVFVTREDGAVQWDQYAVQEPEGAIMIPYDRHNGIRVGLIHIDRPTPQQRMYELPRGLSEKGEDAMKNAARELFEETGLTAGENSIAVIGRHNTDSAHLKTNHVSIVAIEFEKLEEMKNPKADRLVERIRSMKPYSFPDIRELHAKGDLVCGMTMSALSHFGCHVPEFYKY